MKKRHPIQPLEKDPNGVIRFKENKIVSFLLENGRHNLNDLAIMDFTNEDREQFAQLIGYSLSGFGDLSYVSNETYDAADRMAKGEDESEARIKSLESTLKTIRQGLKKAVPAAFKIHPDDLEY